MLKHLGGRIKFNRSRWTRSLTSSPRNFLFAYGSQSTSKVASLVEQSVHHEEIRQLDELILIPSESICFPEAEKMVASPLGNIYAEGQPNLRLSRVSPFLAVDEEMFHSWHRRLNDARYYRGCAEADRVELLAKYYAAQAFAQLHGSPSADQIHINVQGLSGGPANLAIYEAFLEPGDKLLTLNLAHGGHLSHGSPFNVSGKMYPTAHYGVDQQTRKLDYDKIRETALEWKPKMIVGGASAYTWDWDWQRLRSIADEVGAHLHADVCHLAGLIMAGQLSNPLPYADTLMFTTHKTLMGPRGALIATTCEEKAKKIDNAVFPGIQGGPHMNSIAGIARVFEIIVQNRDEYCKLQKNVKDSSKAFADALERHGFSLEYQGTENHMVLIDLKKFQVSNGGYLDGETASRLLENVGIIVNKNTLPGDETAADSSGIRVATPWLAQRGMTLQQYDDLARIMAEVLRAATGFHVWAPSGDEKCRARVPYEQIQKSRQEVLQISRSLPYPKRGPQHVLPDPVQHSVSVDGYTGILVRGEKARLGIHQSMTCDVLGLKENETRSGAFLTPQGQVLTKAVVTNLGWKHNAACGPNGEERVAIFVPNDQVSNLVPWLSGLSDGYIEIEKGDPYMKIDGPHAVSSLYDTEISSVVKHDISSAISSIDDVDITESVDSKAYFIGQSALKQTGNALPSFSYNAPGSSELKKTVLHDWHVKNGGQMVSFGGWDMPVKYENTGIFAEHKAVRTSAALFDVSHMSAVAIEGPYALAFLELIMANTAARLVDNEAQYSYMLRENGVALDDAYVYRLEREKYMIVFNAANFEQDFAWMKAVQQGTVCIDPDHPAKSFAGNVKITALRDAGQDSLLDIAFQGPKSLEVMTSLVSENQKLELHSGKLNDIHHVDIQGIPVMAARTGYTGESVGFELFVHPDQTVDIWEMILEAGKSHGTVAAGLGARDSTRIEAGFPLFGHELEGPEQLSLTEADYGYVSRFHRPFYIGRGPYIARTDPRRKRLLRLSGSGRRSVRPGHAVINEAGDVIGSVTSFAFTDDSFNYNAIAAIDATAPIQPGQTISVARMTPEQVRGEISASKKVQLNVLTRFPTPEEKASWKEKYSQ